MMMMILISSRSLEKKVYGMLYGINYTKYHDLLHGE